MNRGFYFMIVQYWTEVPREVRYDSRVGGLGRRVFCNDLERYLSRNDFAPCWAAPIQARM